MARSLERGDDELVKGPTDIDAHLEVPIDVAKIDLGTTFQEESGSISDDGACVTRRQLQRDLQPRRLNCGGKAFGLREIVKPLLVEKNVDDFDSRAALPEFQTKER